MLVEQGITLGVIIEKRKSASIWIDHTWSVLGFVAGMPDTKPMTLLEKTEEGERFYLGASRLMLHSSETTFYRDNLIAGSPKLWVVLRPDETDGSVALMTITADPAEGEGATQAGNDLVEVLPMPPDVAAEVARFVDAHHVEREHFKRKRDRANPDALAHRPKMRGEHLD